MPRNVIPQWKYFFSPHRDDPRFSANYAFVQRMEPQDVLPMCLPLKLIKNTGDRTLVIAFRNTVMQQGTCDCLFEA